MTETKDDSVWLEATVTVKYLARPINYGTDDPDEMATIDENQLAEYSGDIVDWATNPDHVTVSVRPLA